MKIHLKIIIILVLGLFILPFSTINASLMDDLKQQIEEREREIKELQEQATAYKNSISQAKQKEASLKNELALIDSQIRNLNYETSILRTKIAKTELQIQETRLEIEIKEKDIKERKEGLGEAIRTIYEYDQEDLLDLLLKNDSFSGFLNQFEYIENVQTGLQQNLEELKLLKTKLEENKDNLEKEKEDLLGLSNELEGKTQVAKVQQVNREDLLYKTKNQEKKYQELLSEVKQKQKEIEKEIFELEDTLRRTIDPSAIPAFRSGVLAWPTEGILTQGYGPTSQTGFINDAYEFHNGIDIAASAGTIIRATRDGKIIGVGDDGKYAYGKWIAIEHDNGLTTLYGHLSVQSVYRGQTVKQGQIIGYMGSTGYSTGPHLHFTVYASYTFKIENRWYGLLPLGGSINPMDYL